MQTLFATTCLSLLICAPVVAEQPSVVFKDADTQAITQAVETPELQFDLVRQNPVEKISTLAGELTGEPIADHYAINTDYHQTFSLPIAPKAWRGFQLELFSHLQDPDTYHLNNMRNNSLLKQVVDNHHHDSTSWNDLEMSLGIGMGIPLWQRAKLQTLYSTAPLPGLGDANVVLGLMMDF